MRVLPRLVLTVALGMIGCTAAPSRWEEHFQFVTDEPYAPTQDVRLIDCSKFADTLILERLEELEAEGAQPIGGTSFVSPFTDASALTPLAQAVGADVVLYAVRPSHTDRYTETYSVAVPTESRSTWQGYVGDDRVTAHSQSEGWQYIPQSRTVTVRQYHHFAALLRQSGTATTLLKNPINRSGER